MESDWSAKRGWTPARTLTAFGTDVLGPLSLAADARGDAVIAWAAANRVRVSYRPAGRGWQPPRTLSLSGDSVGAPPGPLVALDDRGRALVAWSATRGSPSSHPSLEIAARSATGAWGKPKVLCACLAARALA